MSSQQNIVIPIVAGIGNALMAEPMVRQLRAALPNAKVKVVATIKAMGEPFARITGVEVIIAGKGAWKMFAALRSAPIDVLIVPFPSNRWQYNVLAKQSGAKRVIMHSYPANHRAWLSGVGERIEAVRGLHDVVQNLRLLEAMSIKPDLSMAPRFVVSEDNDLTGVDLLRKAGVDERRPFIAVHAGSAKTILAAAKRWPVDKYRSLLRAMNDELRVPIVLLEGPDEQGVAHEIQETIPVNHPVAIAHGATCSIVRLSGPLGVAAAVLKRAKFYVGTDSGLAHLAAAVGTRAVTLFAPADPSRVCPFGNDDLVVKPNKSCSPCFLYPWEATKPKMRCREPYCINEISVEMVLEKVRALRKGTRV